MTLNEEDKTGGRRECCGSGKGWAGKDRIMECGRWMGSWEVGAMMRGEGG